MVGQICTCPPPVDHGKAGWAQEWLESCPIHGPVVRGGLASKPWIEPANIGYDLDDEQRAAIAEVNALSHAAWSWAQHEVARRSTTIPEAVRGDGPCADCGTADNIGWYVDSDVWNTTCPPEDGSPILCIPCFAARAHERGLSGIWKLAPDVHNPRSETGGEQTDG